MSQEQPSLADQLKNTRSHALQSYTIQLQLLDLVEIQAKEIAQLTKELELVREELLKKT